MACGRAAYTSAMSMNLVVRGWVRGSTFGISMVMVFGSFSKEVSECQ